MVLADDIYKPCKYKMSFGSIAGTSLMRHNIITRGSKHKGSVELAKVALDLMALCVRLYKGAIN